jgi:exodeoxyribonuclease-1
MAVSFFFYDLETSGFSPREARIMQFGGQRTDMDLKPIGQPVNQLIKLTPDILPSPDAILITGITPQQTLADGMTEAEFLKYFYKEIVLPDTIFVGFNSVRFDDEFMRFLNYRNFYDAYEWQWKDGCSRWDLLDPVRMTRALRPEDIKWPFAPDGKPANRLEYLTSVNKLTHSDAHDALSDVMATIDVARLLKVKQPELFDYLLKHRHKKDAQKLILEGAPFVYTSGRYRSEYLHTTAAVLLSKHPNQRDALVYDLRFDPAPFAQMSIDELVEAWKFSKDPDAVRLPVKTLKYNRCPAVAPLGVMKDEASQKRLALDIDTITKHLDSLKKHHSELTKKVLKVVARYDEEQASTQTTLVDNELTVDEQLYGGSFIGDADKSVMRAIRAAVPDKLAGMTATLHDNRLKNLLPLYKARNYPKNLSQEEQAAWNQFCARKLLAGNNNQLVKYFARLQELTDEKLSGQQKYLLEELKLYGESIVPEDADG